MGWYLEILEDSQRKIWEAYHEFIGEKHGREQAQAEMIPVTDNREGESDKLPS